MTIKNRKAAILIAIGFPVLLFYFLFDPNQSNFMPQCVFHKITGLQCMGCGAQRMLHALLHGDFSAAFRANALLFCALPFIILLFGIELGRTKYPALYSKIHSQGMIIAVAIILMAWFIARNFLGI